MLTSVTPLYLPALRVFPGLLTMPTILKDDIAAAYSLHRLERQKAQKEIVSSPNFAGPKTDPILSRLQYDLKYPQHLGERRPIFADTRHNLVFWAKPPAHIRTLIRRIQLHLSDAARNGLFFALDEASAARRSQDLHRVLFEQAQTGRPPAQEEFDMRKIEKYLWFAPEENLHLTVFEVASGKTAKRVDELVNELARVPGESEGSGVLDSLVEYPRYRASMGQYAELGCPMVTFDSSGIALSFIPQIKGRKQHAVGMPCVENGGKKEEGYNYLELRADLHRVLSRNAPSTPIEPRYSAPSAHITIARFINLDTALDGDGAASGKENVPQHTQVELRRMVKSLVREIDEHNDGLPKGFWGPSGQWSVGDEQGLELRAGACWYGSGGWRVKVGPGIAQEDNMQGKNTVFTAPGFLEHIDELDDYGDEVTENDPVSTSESEE